jgi:hypothetical protein
MANSQENDIFSRVKNPYIRKYMFDKWKEGTPVNGVASQGTLTLSGVVIDGETVTIGGDVYEFCADTAQTVTGSNISVDITSHTTASQGVLTVDTQPTADDTMTIGTKVYTFVADGTEADDGDISVGTDLATAQANIVNAINGDDSINTAHTQVSCGDFATNDATITALIGGTAGDSIATTETFTAETNVFDDTTLGTETAGADCTAGNADGALIGADEGTTYALSQGAGTTIIATASTKGTAGDSIAVSETMANGTWGSGITTLGDTTAGVNGTLGIAGDKMYDTSYLYVAVADNTVSGDNWRRVSLGSAF